MEFPSIGKVDIFYQKMSTIPQFKFFRISHSLHPKQGLWCKNFWHAAKIISRGTITNSKNARAEHKPKSLLQIPQNAIVSHALLLLFFASYAWRHASPFRILHITFVYQFYYSWSWSSAQSPSIKKCSMTFYLDCTKNIGISCHFHHAPNETTFFRHIYLKIVLFLSGHCGHLPLWWNCQT